MDLSLVQNGGQRLLCAACRSGWGPPHLPTPERFRILVSRLGDGSLAPSEERDLRFALEGILERSQGRSETATTLLDRLMATNSMNPYSARWRGRRSDR